MKREDLKISFGMIVVNGEPFIKYNLESLYPHAHEIFVVEGAVEKFRYALPDGHSTDKTVEIVKNFPDPENKIKLIQCDGFWREKNEMSNAYMERCTGDYIWQVDVDEFYKAEDIKKIRSFLSQNPDVTRVEIQTINFWNSFNAVMQGASYCFGADKFRRIFKFKPGYRFLTHRPPTVVDNTGTVCCSENVVTADEIVEKLNVSMFHYSYVFKTSVMSKADYYSQMDWGAGCDDGVKWVETAWSNVFNPLRIHLIDYPPSWIIPFDGEHPAIVLQMIQDLNFEESAAVKDFLIHKWEKYAMAGEYICDICVRHKNSRSSKYKAALLVLKTLMIPNDMQAFSANMTISKTALKILNGNMVKTQC